VVEEYTVGDIIVSLSASELDYLMDVSKFSHYRIHLSNGFSHKSIAFQADTTSVINR